MVGSILLALLLLAPAAVGGEVADRTPGGFTTKTVVTINASPDRVFLAVVEDVGRWWNPVHTWSGNAGNLWMTANPGGCFCETLENGGGVAHAVINQVRPGALLRMTGALGPLQEHAIVGTLTFEFARAGQGTTTTVTYRVAGYFPGGIDTLAGPVDGVIGEQLARLKAFLERGAK